jgi:hypothetical protein
MFAILHKENREMKKRIFGALAFALCIQAAFAAAPDTSLKTTLFGNAFYQVGQIEKADLGYNAGSADWEKVVDQRYGFTIGMNAKVMEHLQIVGAAQVYMWTDGGSGEGQNASNFSIFIPREGEGIYTFGDDPAGPNPWVQVALGYFPFKYDAEAKNFGEYLLNPRTGTYPQYMVTDFDNDQSTVLGLRFSSNLPGHLRQDLLVTSETMVEVPPWGDFSLGYLLGYKLSSMLDVGGGVLFSRLLPVAPTLTTAPADVVFGKNGLPVIENGDTLKYTKQGVKLMLRATFDPKELLPPEIASIFGPEDGKLYAESAILGVKDYGADYPNIWQRNPRMVGFNVPTFRALDVLSIEIEYFNSPYTNDFEGNISGGATPSTSQNEVTNDPLDWSIFATKTIVKSMSVRGLIGKDHYLGYQIDNMGNPDGSALMAGHGTWHYDVKVLYAF